MEENTLYKNGFTSSERKIVYTICCIFISIIFVFWAFKGVAYITRDKELDLNNYEQYVKVSSFHSGKSVDGGSSFDIGLQFECLDRTVTNLYIELEITFEEWSGEFVSAETVTVSFDKLEKGKMRSYTVKENLTRDYSCSYEVISISGDLA